MHALVVFFLLVVPFTAVSALVVLAVVVAQPVKRLSVSADETDAALAVARQVQVRNLAALASGIAVGAGLGIIVTTYSVQVQWLPVLVPMLTAAAAILVFARMPIVAFRESPGVRSADLDRRRPWSAGSRWLFIVAGAASVVLVVSLLLIGASALPDGRSFGYERGPLSGATSPYPGFAFGIPALVGLAALAAAVMIALGRITTAGRPTSTALRQVDSVLRQVAVRVVLKTALSAVLVTIGGVLFIAGGVLKSASYNLELNSGEQLQPALFIGSVLEPVGVISLIAGIVFFVLGVMDAIRKPVQVETVVVSRA